MVENLTLGFEDGVRSDDLVDAIKRLQDGTEKLRPLIDDRAIEGLKITSCVPRQLACWRIA